MPFAAGRSRLALRMSAARAVVFDFNGTLSHDEPVLFAVYRELFSARGRPLSAEEYDGSLAGLRDGLVIHARLEIPSSARHARIEATDAAGRKAWASPFPV
jgi:beta-phosphoglucomutase-like phosphatase (HAD superfamily)